MPTNEPGRSERLSTLERIAYASPAFFLSVVILPLYVFVPRFYTDVVGLRVETVGQVLLAARIFDAVSDPAIGAVSDAIRRRWWRRRAFIALASLPLAGAIYLLLAPAAGSGTPAFIVAVFLVYFCWTLVVVPYEAMGIEETRSYDERTSVLGLREALGLIGVLVALATPPLVGELFGLGDEAAAEREKMRTFALLYGAPLVLCCWFCALAVRERRRAPARPGATGLRELYRAFADNRPFLVLVGAFAVVTMAANLGAALLLFYVRYVLELANGELYMLLYIGSGILCAPLWVLFARRFEKRTAWITALLVSAVAYLAMTALGSGDALPFVGLVVLAGIPFGGLMILPSAMQADAVDLGEERHRGRREGLHVGAWNVARKAPGAVGVGVALWILGVSGYDANVPQTEHVLRTLRLLYCVVPGVLMVLAAALSIPYSIDRRRHARIEAAIRGEADA